MNETSESTEPRAKARKWPERVWLLLALVLLLAAAGLFGLRRLVDLVTSGGITHQIMPGLEQAERIAADAGDLRDFNVLIITVDTTRADHVGCYGNRSVETPVIDGLARDGILCAQTVTPSPSTLPGHSSLMTGLYPVHHGARANGTFRLADDVTTLAERLKAKGYRTGAVISAFVLDSRFGLDQGFDLYDDDLTKGMRYSKHMFRERAAELTNEPASRWLRENSQQPFFLWIHYFDPHAVYLPPEPFRSRYENDPYDGEIAYVDSQIGVILRQLESLGVRDKTLVIYTSDHGEGLGEHGEQTHSLLVYDATLHVPLIFNAPARLPAGKVLDRQTCLVDVVPTVLALLGDPVPEDVDGVNLCAAPLSEERPVLIETIATMTLHGWAPLVGVRRNDHKYILAPTPELYNLRNDPRELENLYDKGSEVVRDLSEKLAAWLGDDPFLAARQAIDLSAMAADKETLRHLSALGYVASAPEASKDAPSLKDPKEMIAHWETVQHAINLRAQGQAKAAIPILEKCLAAVPGDVFARSVLAAVYHQMGDFDRALTHYQHVVRDDPNNQAARLGIAGVHVSRHEYDKAEKIIAEAQDIEPENAQPSILLGEMAWFRGDEEAALELYRKALEMDPGSVGPAAYNHIGSVHLYAGRLDEAREAYRNTIRIDALNGSAHDGLANILIREGNLDAARKELQLALNFDPNQTHALSTLASLLSKQGNQDEAKVLCQRALDLSPKFALAHNTMGLICRRQDELDLAEKHYLKAIEYAPRLDAAHVNLAQLYARQGKLDDAIEQFRRAVVANRHNPNPIALANLGVFHFNKKQYPRALALYRRALQIDPDYALVHKYIASLYATEDWSRPDLAAHHLRRSLELDPGQPDARQLRGILRDVEKAAANFKPAAPGTTVDSGPEPADADPGATVPGSETESGSPGKPSP